MNVTFLIFDLETLFPWTSHGAEYVWHMIETLRVFFAYVSQRFFSSLLCFIAVPYLIWIFSPKCLAQALILLHLKVFQGALLLIPLPNELELFSLLLLSTLCSLWDLSSPTRDWTQATAVKVLSPNHWIARGFLDLTIKKKKYLFIWLHWVLVAAGRLLSYSSPAP